MKSNIVNSDDKINIRQIAETLRHCGLNEKLRTVYAGVLLGAEQTVSDISKLTGIARTNLYALLEELEAEGYVKRSKYGKVQRYSAVNPNRIARELKESSRQFEEMLPLIQAIHTRKGGVSIQVYRGVEGAKIAFSQISYPKHARYAINLPQARSFLGSGVARWTKQYASKRQKGHSQHFIVGGTTKDPYWQTLARNGQNVKAAPEDFPLNLDIALVDGVVYLASEDDGEIRVTVLRSVDLFESFSALFDLLWSRSSPVAA